MNSAREAEAVGREAHTLDGVLEQARESLRRRVAFDCFAGLALDPVSHVPIRVVYRTRLRQDQLPRAMAIQMTEYRHGTIADVPSRLREKACLLSAAAGGALRESSYYREILHPLELEPELRVFLRAGGLTWGYLFLVRDIGEPDFEPEEVELVAQMSTPIAESIRRTLVVGPRAPCALDSPAVIVLSADDRVVSCSDASERLLDDLADVGLRDLEKLPASLRSVALIARAPHEGLLPMARTRTRSGAWLTVRGTPLGGQGVALVIEPSRAQESAWLTLAGYGLSPRECTIALHVLRGLSTEDVSQVLGISRHTVQDHFRISAERSSRSTQIVTCEPSGE